MTRRMILHIGRYETGTTGLRLCPENRRAGLSGVGGCNPVAGCSRSAGNRRAQAGQRDPARRLNGPRGQLRQKLAALRPAFRDGVAEAHALILSSEGFRTVPHPDLRAGGADGVGIETICSRREDLTNLAHLARSDARTVKASALSSDFSDPESHSAFDIAVFVARGKANSRRSARGPCDRGRPIDGDVIADFIAIADLPLAPGLPAMDPSLSVSETLPAFRLIANMPAPDQDVPMLALPQAPARRRGRIDPDRDRTERPRRKTSRNRVLRDMFGAGREIGPETDSRILDPAGFERGLTTIPAEFSGFTGSVGHPPVPASARGAALSEGCEA
ncbi:hypothetical protein [Rhodovulum sp. YEN HP10]|uniref:hypothetical protein n=1 Tax=Rhodovulum sp. HP10 TaxID=3387397 RepID=UPI0039E051BD